MGLHTLQVFKREQLNGKTKPPQGQGQNVNTEEGGGKQKGISRYNLSERGKGEIHSGEGNKEGRRQTNNNMDS